MSVNPYDDEIRRQRRKMEDSMEAQSIGQGLTGLFGGLGDLRRSNIQQGQQQLLARQVGDVVSGAQTPEQAAAFASQSAQNYQPPGTLERFGQLFGSPFGAGSSQQTLNPQGSLDLSRFAQSTQQAGAEAGIAQRKEQRSIEAHEGTQEKLAWEREKRAKETATKQNYSKRVSQVYRRVESGEINPYNADQVLRNAENDILDPDNKVKFRNEHRPEVLRRLNRSDEQVEARKEEMAKGLETAYTKIDRTLQQIRLEKDDPIDRVTKSLRALESVAISGIPPEQKAGLLQGVQQSLDLMESENPAERELGREQFHQLRQDALALAGRQTLGYAYMAVKGKNGFYFQEIPPNLGRDAAEALNEPDQESAVVLLRRLMVDTNIKMGANMLVMGRMGIDIETMLQRVLKDEFTPRTARDIRWIAQQVLSADPIFTQATPPPPQR